MAILDWIATPIVNAVVAPFTDLFKSYLNKQITESELRAKMVTALIAGFADVEKAYADSLAKTFASFMDAAKQSRLMQSVWAAVALSQLAVLLWHQVGIPALVLWMRSGNPDWVYPSSGTTVEWSYLLIALCLGGGAIALKMAPGSGSAAQIESLKKLIVK
jgi:hypothetical protein